MAITKKVVTKTGSKGSKPIKLPKDARTLRIYYSVEMAGGEDVRIISPGTGIGLPVGGPPHFSYESSFLTEDKAFRVNVSVVPHREEER
jgi:hypothetical protein